MKRHICFILFLAIFASSCKKNSDSDSQGYSFTRLANIGTTNTEGGFLLYNNNIQYFSYEGGEWWEYDLAQDTWIDHAPAPITNFVTPFIHDYDLYVAGYAAGEGNIKIFRYNTSTSEWGLVTQVFSNTTGLKYLFSFGNKVYFSLLYMDFPKSICIDLASGTLSDIGQQDYFLNRRSGTYGCSDKASLFSLGVYNGRGYVFFQCFHSALNSFSIECTVDTYNPETNTWTEKHDFPDVYSIHQRIGDRVCFYTDKKMNYWDIDKNEITETSVSVPEEAYTNNATSLAIENHIYYLKGVTLWRVDIP